MMAAVEWRNRPKNNAILIIAPRKVRQCCKRKQRWMMAAVEWRNRPKSQESVDWDSCRAKKESCQRRNSYAPMPSCWVCKIHGITHGWQGIRNCIGGKRKRQYARSREQFLLLSSYQWF